MSADKTTTAPEAEATGADTVTVNYDGRDWTFPAGLEAMRYSQQAAYESGQLSKFLPAVLPPDEMKVIVEKDPSMKWVKGLADAWAQAAGFENAGE